MTKTLTALLAAGLFSACAHAQVVVSEPWTRATVPHQKSSGAFMRLRSDVDARLVAAATPVAGRTEIHEMAMNGNVMRMRPVTAIELPAGKPVNLASGGYHIMLFDLKRQLKEGDTIPMSLVVEGAQGKRETIELQVPVKSLTHSTTGMHH